MKGTQLKQKKESNDNLETQINSCTNIVKQIKGMNNNNNKKKVQG